ncbi:hypothetical protein JTE90_026246 [Oedothorax gibbosus]|uniref:Uncharacterized protein n=1 Tax=Oedothorax gibbosus TaxID=931172 RepID=A0AAV6U6I3_9ARAC|nr:hypothetical protein JTE90_026246 [Oedothorax gibbosus]
MTLMTAIGGHANSVVSSHARVSCREIQIPPRWPKILTPKPSPAGSAKDKRGPTYSGPGRLGSIYLYIFRILMDINCPKVQILQAGAAVAERSGALSPRPWCVLWQTGAVTSIGNKSNIYFILDWKSF